jgi:hypothetical protein
LEATDGGRTDLGEGGPLVAPGDGGGTFGSDTAGLCADLPLSRLDLADAISSKDGTTGGFGLVFFSVGWGVTEGFAGSPPDSDSVGTWMSALHFGHLPRLPAFSSDARKELSHFEQVTTMLTTEPSTGDYYSAYAWVRLPACRAHDLTWQANAVSSLSGPRREWGG